MTLVALILSCVLCYLMLGIVYFGPVLDDTAMGLKIVRTVSSILPGGGGRFINTPRCITCS